MAGQLYQGVTLGGVVDNPGGTFINCTFLPGTVLTGDGMAFVDCTFNGTAAQNINVPGTGSTIDGGSVNYTNFGPATVIGFLTVLLVYTVGSNSNVKGSMFTFTKPIVRTNTPCQTQTEGDAPAEVKDFCLNSNVTGDEQSTEGSRA